jgi:hypothetical protein
MSYATETQVSVEKTRAEIERMITKFGASRFMSGTEMSQPCDCGEDECNVVCWREKCKARYFANWSRLPSGF